MITRSGGGLARRLAAALLFAGLAACQTAGRLPAPVVAVEAQRPWARHVAPEHIAMLDSIDSAWARALAAARAARFARTIGAEGPLLDAAAGQAWVVPSPGSYRCRRIRLGGAGRRVRGYAVAGPFFCHLGDEGEQLSLTQQTGSERPGGYLWSDGERRMVFVGALSRGREAVAPTYGDSPDRDLVGLFERIGPFRYRLVLPRPDGGLDVIEMVPSLPPD